MQQLRQRLTYANVMSSIAVFLVLGGSALAATQLGKNSVGSKQLKSNAVTAAKIKKNAVTGAKIKSGAVTGSKIDLATLGTVPKAAVAETIPPAEPTHFVGTAGEPPFQGESTNAGPEAGYAGPKVGFYKDHEGIVHLTGLAKTDPAHTTIFILPPGYRPAAGTVATFLGLCGPTVGACEADSPGGDESRFAPVIVAGANASIETTNVEGRVLSVPGVLISLDGITFRAES
jgi:hypothetical protein